MRAYVSFKMNRPINKEIDYISPGGYEVTAKDGKIYQFDFNDSYGYIDENDRSIIHFELRNPDYDSFQDMNEFKNHIHEIVKFNELYLYIDDMGLNDPLKCEKVLSFCIDDDTDQKETPVNSEYIICEDISRNNYCVSLSYKFTNKLLETIPL